jgi:hypothetical protein
MYQRMRTVVAQIEQVGGMCCGSQGQGLSCVFICLFVHFVWTVVAQIEQVPWARTLRECDCCYVLLAGSLFVSLLVVSCRVLSCLFLPPIEKDHR